MILQVLLLLVLGVSASVGVSAASARSLFASVTSPRVHGRRTPAVAGVLCPPVAGGVGPLWMSFPLLDDLSTYVVFLFSTAAGGGVSDVTALCDGSAGSPDSSAVVLMAGTFLACSPAVSQAAPSGSLTAIALPTWVQEAVDAIHAYTPAAGAPSIPASLLAEAAATATSDRSAASVASCNAAGASAPIPSLAPLPSGAPSAGAERPPPTPTAGLVGAAAGSGAGRRAPAAAAAAVAAAAAAVLLATARAP